jgi:predicted phage terminase large subunit-like protein
MIGIIMNTEEQAAEMLESIKAELDTNPRLALDFPESVGRGKVWQATTAITANNIKIRIGGTGKKIRGMKHGAYRPDLIFLDDLENDEQVRQKAQRDKVAKYVLSAVLGLAPPSGGMDVFWVGTSLHYDAAINQVGDMPGWSKFVFKAIMRMPDNMALWDKWEAIYAVRGDNATKQAAALAAKRFFESHKTAMLAGAKVSWEIRPLYKLMCIRATDHKSFDQEYQNQAGNDDDAPFKNITFWVNRLAEWVFYGAIDPSLGKKGKDGVRRGDPSAILVGGFNRNTMKLDVVEADICRRPVNMIITRAVEYQEGYRCLAWAIESVQFQYVLNDLLLKEGIVKNLPFPAVPVIPIGDKDLRIISLQPHVNNELIRIGHHQSTLYEQLFYYPEADHDDGPDALEMLWKIATEYSGEYSYTSANQSRNSRHSGDSESLTDCDDDFYGEDRR